MSKSEIEPLEPSMWFAEIEHLYARRAEREVDEPSAVFRMAYYLLQLAPRPLEAFLPTNLQEASIEAFLECNAFADAALALFGTPVGLTLTRDAGSAATKATITIPGAGSEGVDSDDDPARAMLGAWCQALLSLRQPSASSAMSGRDPGTPAPASNSDASIH